MFNNDNRIIGFCGRMRSGKTMLAEAMKEKYGATIVTVASSLKQLLGSILNMDIDTLNIYKNNNEFLNDFILCDKSVYDIINRETDINIEDIEKECIYAQNHHDGDKWNVRQLLQFIGTDIIRKYNKNWIIERLKDNIRKAPVDKYVAVDDVRFENEVKAIESLGGKCFFIIRPWCVDVRNHSSENSLYWQDFPDKNILINDNTKEKTISLWFDYLEKHFRYAQENYLTLTCNKTYCSMNYLFGTERYDLVNKILDQNKDSNLFLNDGIIVYKVYNPKDATEYLYDVMRDYKISGDNTHTFVLYNPLITENLKRWL